MDVFSDEDDYLGYDVGETYVVNDNFLDDGETQDQGGFDPYADPDSEDEQDEYGEDYDYDDGGREGELVVGFKDRDRLGGMGPDLGFGRKYPTPKEKAKMEFEDQLSTLTSSQSDIDSMVLTVTKYKDLELLNMELLAIAANFSLKYGSINPKNLSEYIKSITSSKKHILPFDIIRYINNMSDR